MRRFPAVLLALALAACTAAPARARPGAALGIYDPDPVYLNVAQNLGLCRSGGYVRMSADNTKERFNTAKAAAIRGAGCKVQLTISNIACKRPDGSGISCAPTNDGLYQKQIAAVLDAFHPDLVNIQNEVDAEYKDGGRFYQRAGGVGTAAGEAATAAAYLHQLTLAVQVAHSTGPYAGRGRHYIITGDGISSSGANIAYWEYLHTHAPCKAADAFADAALVNGPLAGVSLTDDIPTCGAPGRAADFPGHPPVRGVALIIPYLLAGYAATGIDFLNLHWYWYSSDTHYESDIVAWARAQSGMTRVGSNEGGERDRDGSVGGRAAVQAMLATADRLGFEYFIWFTPSHAKVSPLNKEDGSLSDSGQAFKDTLASGR